MEKPRKLVRVIIAQPIPEEQQRIAELLGREGSYQICCMTHDGLECLRQVVADQPELVILDTVLDKIDGLEVLRRLKEFSLSGTKCLMLTSYQGYLQERATLVGADDCLLAPYTDSALLQRVRALTAPPEAFYSDQEIDDATVSVLRDMGVRERLKAYPYVIQGMRILIRDPGLIRRRKVIRELYGGIAQQEGVSTIRVERTLRTLTARLFDPKKTDPQRLALYFDPEDIQRCHITNSDFFCVLAQAVRETLEREKAAGKGCDLGRCRAI